MAFPVVYSSSYDGAGSGLDRHESLRDDRARCTAAEEALERNNEVLRTALDAAQLGTWSYDGAQRKVSLDELGMAILGLQDVRYFRLDEGLALVYAEDRRYVVEHIRRALRSGTKGPYRMEFRVVHPDGSIHWVQTHGKRLRNDTIGNLIGTVRDISEPKRSEWALHESEERLVRTLEHSPVIVYSQDLELRYTWVCYPGFGLDIADILGRTDHEIHGDGARHMESVKREVIRTARPVRREVYLPSLGNKTWWDLWVEPQFGTGGEVVGIHCVATDITDRKDTEVISAEHEYQFRLAREVTGLGVFEYLPVTGDLTWDDQVRAFWGVPPGEPVTIDTFVAGIHPDDRAMVATAISDVEDPSKASAYDIEYRVLPLDGGPLRWIHAVARCYFDGTQAQRRATRIVGGAQDITARKQAQIALQQREAELQDLTRSLEERVAERTLALEQRNRELQGFAYVASHDLQEPLRKIQTFASMLLHDYGNELNAEARHYVNRMDAAAGRASLLLADVLAFSRVATRAQPFVHVNLEAIAHEVIADHDLSITERNALVEVDAGMVVQADPGQIRQVLNHLVMNALKFQKPGVPPEITIRAETDPAYRDGSRCLITVEDNGIGFEPQFAERIFEPFQRLHGRSEYPGSGMGLAICRHIVERHQGTIRAEGRPGLGSRFFVHLPYKQDSGL